MYDIYPIFIIIYRVPGMFMICDRYFTTRYMCNMCTIIVGCITVFPHLYYTYQVPDMCEISKYHTHIIQIFYTYRVPDMYPITLILTSVHIVKILTYDISANINAIGINLYYWISFIKTNSMI
jgi:hypothetical protein